MNIFTLFESEDVESIKLGVQVIKTLGCEKEFEDYFEIPFHNLTKTFQFFSEYNIKNKISFLNKKITIEGNLFLNGLQVVDKDFLKETTINGYLGLNGLETVDKDFLKGTTINGDLHLSGVQTVDREIIMKNINK